MKVAEITCLTRMVSIPDLGLNLFKGDVVHISEDDATQSADLALMRRLNAVHLQWVKRGDPKAVPPPRPVKAYPPSEPGQTQVDLEQLAAQIAARPRPAPPPVNGASHRGRSKTPG